MSNTDQATKHQSIEYFQFERKEMLEFLPVKYKTVLEIGCAEGGFKDLLGNDCEYWGVEYDGNAASIAKGKLHKVFVGQYSDIEEQLANNYFDLVICNDVIEHMYDERAFLHSIKTKMNSQGTIIISLPNVRYIKNIYELLVKKDWRYRDAGILDRTHLRFFTQKSIEHTMQDAGFYIGKINGINTAIRSQSPLKKMMQYLIYLPMTIIFGRDILFMQLGLSAKKQASD